VVVPVKMDYDAILDYIDSFIDFEKIPRYSYASSFRLDRMYAFLQELGNPHHALSVIHIAGSKGKGSTCTIMAALLREAGYCVGLYTSPHLLDARERIRVLIPYSPHTKISPYHRLQRNTGQADFVRGTPPVVRGPEEFEGMIEKEEFIGLIGRIRPVAERFRDHKRLGRLSFFEILTSCAFLYFKEKEVDVAILETGLGGRLDATNVTIPIACGITNISLEHTDKLGASLGSIAREKAGIVKVQGTVISASQEKEARDVIRGTCGDKRARLYEIDKDINYSILRSKEEGQVFNLEGPDYSYKGLEINLIGPHQVENASLAIAILRAIGKNRFEVKEEAVRTGLKDILWPGRLQIVQRNPYLILDGAQNVASIRRVLSSIKAIFKYNRLISVFGISSDKDIEGVSRELDRSSDAVILTRSRTERAEDPFYLRKNFCRSILKLTGNVEEALRQGLEMAEEKDLILVTGSFYVVGEAMKSLNSIEAYG